MKTGDGAGRSLRSEDAESVGLENETFAAGKGGRPKPNDGIHTEAQKWLIVVIETIEPPDFLPYLGNIFNRETETKTLSNNLPSY